ncbi:30S ribosomal protein THX [Sphingobacterium corticibacter]|uniref:30S ribosomal protein THX n=1 Tax=Sphingobacterium corticibacter TaxID=2171749 RepID=A0A2T8HMH1_9SPHI|nr:30S ribosomal protein THX [Sphingobacterium corticibacter]PVH26648.1 30S ribosomal protein THX [Sphingobacterium corticibacter]
MGKGDKKTKRGKIITGSYGTSRPGKRTEGRKASDTTSAKKVEA